MSDNYSTSEEANKWRMGVGLTDVEEIMDNSEQPKQEETIEYQELRRRLFKTEASYSQQRETYDRLFEHGLDIEKSINETAAENKILSSKVKDLQKNLENMRKARKEEEEEEEEEVFRRELLSEEKIRDRFVYIREMEKEKIKLRKQNENLTAELEQLSRGQNNQEQIKDLTAASQELQHNLGQVQEEIRSKDEEIEMKSLSLIQRSNEQEENLNTIEDLRQEQRELREQLSRRQEEYIIAAQEASTDSEPLGNVIIYEKYEKDEEHKEETSWWPSLKGLWKGAKVLGQVALCVLLPVIITASIASVCDNPHPDCNLCSVSFGLLEPRLDYAFPKVY